MNPDDFANGRITDETYNNLVQIAAAKRHMVVRALQKKHLGADIAAIHDFAEGALIKFSDREKILNIRNPEKPFSMAACNSRTTLLP